MRAMTGGGVAKSRVFLIREAKRVDHQRRFSKLRGSESGAEEITSGGMIQSDSESDLSNEMIKRESGSATSSPSCRCSWVPHARTGIYVPKGHEWVMDDVPKGAASLNQTFWLRNVDGVLEKPDPDTPPHHYYHFMHM